MWSPNAPSSLSPEADAFDAGKLAAHRFVAVDDTTGAVLGWVAASATSARPASLTLHERAGFRRVGMRERIARSDAGPFAGAWRDTVLIERCSPTDPS